MNNSGIKRSFKQMNAKNIIQNPNKKQRLIADINPNKTVIPNTNNKLNDQTTVNNESDLQTIAISNIIRKIPHKKGVIIAENSLKCDEIYANLQNDNVSCLVYNEQTTNDLSNWIEDEDDQYQIIITTLKMLITVLIPDIKYILTPSQSLITVLKASKSFMAESNSFLIWKSDDCSANIQMPMISHIHNSVELVRFVMELMYLNENECSDNCALLIHKIINKSKSLNVKQLMDIWSSKASKSSLMDRQNVINTLFVQKYLDLNLKYSAYNNTFVIGASVKMTELVNKSKKKKQNISIVKLINHSKKAKAFYDYVFDQTNWLQMNITESKSYWHKTYRKRGKYNYIILNGKGKVKAILFFEANKAMEIKLELQIISNPKDYKMIIYALNDIIPKIFRESKEVSMIDMCLWTGDKQGENIAKALKFEFEKRESIKLKIGDIESPGIDQSMFNPKGLDQFKLRLNNWVLHKE